MIAVTASISEEWRPVVGFEDWYEVSNTGKVKRIKRAKGATVGMVIPWNLNPGGYPTTYLSCDRRRYAFMIHLLVARAFIGPSNGLEVNHRDGNKKNNHLSNLEYVTRQQNADHAKERGMYSRGVNVHSAILNPRMVRRIRTLASDGHKPTAISRKMKVSRSAVAAVYYGQTWTWLR